MATKSPVRYIVLHSHKPYNNSQSENAWASYNTKLDAQSKTTALNMAFHTASRYHGEVFADFGDGMLNSVKSYRKDSNV